MIQRESSLKSLSDSSIMIYKNYINLLSIVEKDE